MSTQTKHGAQTEQGEIEIRQCMTIDELESCVRLQREVFGGPEIEITPRRHLIMSRRAGGWTLGAFAGGELVGFAHLMVAVRGGHEIIGYSHMMAVAESYQNFGIGARLKWAQRERALGEGREYITWTWHPMQARNAYFNLKRLGVTVRSYGVNFYGTDYDSTSVEGATHSPGIDSDRLFAEWDLNSSRVVALSKARAPVGISAPPVRSIEIPPDWLTLVKSDRARARREQQRVREEFISAFDIGLVCTGFERDREHPRYLLYETVTADG